MWWQARWRRGFEGSRSCSWDGWRIRTRGTSLGFEVGWFRGRLRLFTGRSLRRFPRCFGASKTVPRYNRSSRCRSAHVFGVRRGRGRGWLLLLGGVLLGWLIRCGWRGRPLLVQVRYVRLIRTDCWAPRYDHTALVFSDRLLDGQLDLGIPQILRS